MAEKYLQKASKHAFGLPKYHILLGTIALRKGDPYSAALQFRTAHYSLPEFLTRTGRNPQASIYKVLDRFGEVLPSEPYYRAFYEKKTNEHLGYEDLISFIDLLNSAPDEDFADELAAAMDVESYLDYYAIQVLTANTDSARHNIYLLHDLATDKWELVPWGVTASLP